MSERSEQSTRPALHRLTWRICTGLTRRLSPESCEESTGKQKGTLMIEIIQEVAGIDRVINVIEEYGEVTEFLAWAGNQEIVTVDTETTGLDLFSDTFRVRLVQFGTQTEAWVIPVELGDEYTDVARPAIVEIPRLVLQNAAYDIIALKQACGIAVDRDKVRDTKILAHLADPRELKEGGIGHSLSDLTRALIDTDVADDIKDSMKHMASEAGTTQG